MALFDRKAEHDEDLVSGTDAGSRALSVAAVENDFVEGVYDKLAKVYDLTFGPTLHPGRLQAIQRMGLTDKDRVLEVGVGTGINLSLYPREAAVVGIDFSSSMLEKARERAARKDVPRSLRLLPRPSLSRSIRHSFRVFRRRCRGARSGCTARASKASTCAAGRSLEAASAGPTDATTSAPRSSG